MCVIVSLLLLLKAAAVVAAATIAAATTATAIVIADVRLRCDNSGCTLFGAKRLGTRAVRSSPAGEAGEAKPAVCKLQGPLLSRCRTL